jgi:amidase
MTHELIKLTAREAVALLRKRQVSPLELVDAAIARIEEVDDAVNALPIRCFDRARDQAKKIMGEGTKALERRLVGLPIAVKDLNRLSGVRTTWGSPVFQDYVADRSDIGVETLERNGAIPVAKSNVPELGIGANTTNPVFGATRNPWNTDLTCGGSSGGAAVSVATGAVWLAGGSDGGCSLRVPASFCSVATLRPTPGRVASGTTSQVGPRHSLWETLSVEGPIGRTVGDVALMFEAQIGAHPLDPRSMPLDGTSFIETVDAPTVPRRIAFSRDLGGVTKVATEVGDIAPRRRPGSKISASSLKRPAPI